MVPTKKTTRKKTPGKAAARRLSRKRPQERIAELEARVREGGVQEVVLATNPNAEGDATAHYLGDRLRQSGVRMTRIAYGMPMGGDLEYADQVTVGRSLQYRRELD